MGKKEKKIKVSTECKKGKKGKKVKNVKESHIKGTGHTLNDIGGEVKKKRGRPKKVVVYTESDGYDKQPPIITVIHKFEGYCPKCKVSIGSLDIKGTKFICISCGEEGKAKKLLKGIERNGPKNKKEYLEIYYSNFTKKDTIAKIKSIKEIKEDPDEPIIITSAVTEVKDDLIEKDIGILKTDEEDLLESEFLDPKDKE